MVNIIGKVQSVGAKSKDEDGVIKHQLEIKLELLDGTEKNIEAIRKMVGNVASFDTKQLQLSIDK